MTSGHETDILLRPLEVVQKLIFEDNLSIADISTHFQNQFPTPAALSLIPALTHTSLPRLPTGRLVRFRCMVQDNSFNAQEYFHTMTLRNTTTGAEHHVSTVYRDTLPEMDGWVAVEPDMRHFRAGMVGEKHPVYCVAVPAETEWVREGEVVEEMRRMSLERSETRGVGGDDAPVAIDPRLHVKFPIKDDANTVAALVKTYGSDPQFRLNDAIEVVGVLEHITVPPTPSDDTPDMTIPMSAQLEFPPDTAEQAIFTTVPRIHVVFHRVLSQLDLNPAAANVDVKDVDLEMWREEVIEVLKGYLGGDAMAAEYLLLHLISKIDHRAPDDTPIGYFPLNLTNIPTDADASFTPTLVTLLASLLPRVHRVPLSLTALNEHTWIAPAQKHAAGNDEAADKLDMGLHAGELQLVDGTWVVVDETALEDGTLNERGISNLSHLGTTLRTAKLPYLIPYGDMTRDVDYGVLVLSQGKCMFGVDCTLPLRPTTHGSTRLPPFPAQLLAQTRALLATLRSPPTSYTIPPAMVDTISSDYAAHRRAGETTMDMQALSTRLEVAKLVARSCGKHTLDTACWERARRLEVQRRTRLREVAVGSKGKRDGDADGDGEVAGR
ncbi:hypothetical protein PhCBS80983_g03945 [Powellomyces hirtus]|uniref:Mini-chromosome maintenance complex-binding protein n=1 Tax=Powellomyces hirtus TaxID=109895 RepID=A0A507E2C7_9FUNG|nr:hypothetical protein PhCBS80983_g03945 [Powellomyces hirtus]